MGFPPVEDGWVRAVEDGPGRGFRWVFLGEVALGAVLAGCAWAVLPGLGPQLGGEPGWGDPCQGFSAGVSDSPDAVESESKTPVIQDTTVDVVDAQRWLCALPLREVEGVEGYRRQAFGAGWLDLDGDGCDTRQEILAPPNRGYRCPYAYHQVYIKYRWGLSVTAAERRALWAQLQLCH